MGGNHLRVLSKMLDLFVGWRERAKLDMVKNSRLFWTGLFVVDAMWM